MNDNKPPSDEARCDKCFCKVKYIYKSDKVQPKGSIKCRGCGYVRK